MSYSIAMFGAFNVCSFGDTMFPIAVQYELSKLIEIDNLDLFSLGGGISGYYENSSIHSYEEFETLNETKKYDAIIIGGGELFHNKEITFENGKIKYPKGEIWKKPIEYGKKYQLPVILNGIGMPYEFETSDAEEIKELIKNVNYISLRDEFSYKRWKKSFGNLFKAYMIPDTLWCIKDYFKKEELNRKCRSLRNKYGIEKEYFLLQYGTTKEYEEVYEIVKNYASNVDMQIVVIAINASHEDRFVVDHLKAEENSVIISDVLSPMEIAALISQTELFIGTSLHGNLTASAYGKRNVILDMYPEFVSKLDGFAQMTGNDNNFVCDIKDLWSIIDYVYQHDNKNANIAEKMRKETHAHYARLCEVIESKIMFNEVNDHLSIEQENSPADELFKKGYFKTRDKNGREVIYKRIAERRDNEYSFVFDLDDFQSNEEVLFCGAIKSPCKVTIKNESGIIVEKNAVKDDKYLNMFFQWKLERKKKYNLICKYEKLDFQQIENELWNEYNNKSIHEEEMILKERRYLGKISYYRDNKVQLESTIQNMETKGNTDQQTIQELQNSNSKLQENISDLETELNNIKNSKMYKGGRYICRVLDVIKVTPIVVVKSIGAFCRMMTHVNIQELKIAAGYVKNEGVVGAYHHLMRDYHKGDLKKIQVDIDQKIYDEIKTMEECEHLTLPYYEKPLVSIVIPAYNQFTYTYYCIKSIIENSGNISYEVILADDCSTDLTTQITSIVDNLVVAKTESNMLFLRNCNHAAKQAKGEYILFLNNDTQVQKDWLSPLVQLCERDSSIGMVGSKLVYADGTLQEAGGIIWKDGTGWNYGRNDDAMKPEYNYVRDVDYISGAAIMIRHDLWKTIGGFDEYFAPAYCEDSDLAFMVRKAGYRVVYQPASVVVHFEGKSNGTDLNFGVKKYQVENSNKLKEKWKVEFAKQYDNAQCVFKARERSQNKKVILVIDHYVPQFDKDAGSKTTMQYLKMFVQQGYSVKFMGDNFYQDEPYTSILQQMGVEVLYGPWYAEYWKEWILENKNYIDFAYLNRPHITIKYIDFLKENTNIKCIYYGHDLHFLRLQREYELSGDISKKQESEEWLEKELYIMRKADISYYPSYVEEEEIHKIDPSINVKAITAYVYEQFKEDIQKDFTLREGILFVGGFGHPPNEDAVLWFTKEVLPKIEEKISMPFYIVGSKATDAVKKLNGGNIIVKGFVSEEELAQLYNTCKMVVVPLRYGAGVKGKVVEALYYGAPMVTTSVGAEGISGADKIISIADDADSFANAVIETYNDDKKLAATVDAYQAFVKDYFSVDAVWKIVKDDFS